MDTFTRGDKVWAFIDGKRIRAVYDEASGDGFHYVKVYVGLSDHPDYKWPELFRLTDFEITERL